MNDTITELTRPEAYPAPSPARVEVEETHASMVFLTEHDVYKVKKPVRFGFLDHTTPLARRRACEAEVVLNERLATSVYRGVVPVCRSSDGHLNVRGEGAIVDWAVHMVRLPDDARADHMLARGRLSDARIEALADHVAAFHRRARSGTRIGSYGSAEAIRQNVRDNLDETRRTRRLALSDEESSAIERAQLAFSATQGELFESRRERGFVRDVHGDLRLEHCYFGPVGAAAGAPDITIVDCIEFSDRFRCSDVVADIAFLSMDLAVHGRVDLAELLLARYARSTGDWDLFALVDFYEAYRAVVRAKVALFQAEAAADAPTRERAIAQARRHFLLALAGGRRPVQPPSVVCVGGVIASGKTTLSEALARAMGAPVVDADRTRKELLHLEPTTAVNDRPFTGAYDLRVTSSVYAELMRRAGLVVRSGRPVVLDASFRAREMRLAARELARLCDVPFLFIECRASREDILARLEARARGPRTASDGRAEILGDFVASWEPVTELPHGEHLILDTTQPLEASAATARRRLRTWPAGLVA